MHINKFEPLLESKEASESEAKKYENISKKVMSELGLNLHLTATFGFGIGFFYPIVYNLVQNMNITNIEITDEMSVMLTMCVFSILLKDNKKEIKKLLEEIRMNGTYGVAKKLVKGLECIKDIVLLIFKNLGKGIITMVDMFSYSAIFVPCAVALNSIIKSKDLGLDDFINHFITFGIGTLTITAKHLLINLIDKLKSLGLKLDDNKVLKFFKTTKDTIVKKFGVYSKDEIINEIITESDKYFKEISEDKENDELEEGEEYWEPELEEELEEFEITNYTINDDGTIDVDGDVDLSGKGLKKIPFRFGKVTGNFEVDTNELDSLEGSPYYVGGNFYCFDNNLENLIGSPDEVVGTFDCSGNQLETLEGMTLEIGGDFICYDNTDLRELDSLSNIEGQIKCSIYLDIRKFKGYCSKIKNTFNEVS